MMIPAPPVAAQTAPPASQTCSIKATNGPWDPPGTMLVSIDGTPVGSFAFGPDGNPKLSFSCTPGVHAFTFTAKSQGIAPTSCSGKFTIGDEVDFLPGMVLLPDGSVRCVLR